MDHFLDQVQVVAGIARIPRHQVLPHLLQVVIAVTVLHMTVDHHQARVILAVSNCCIEKEGNNRKKLFPSFYMCVIIMLYNLE